MEEQFVPYELALRLKELGFNEECFRVKLKNSPEHWYTQTDYKDYPKQKKEEVLIPLWQQAFDWFREKGLNPVIYKVEGHLWDWDIQDDNVEEDEVFDIDLFKTYQEARLECLKKLIEIVENYE